MPKDTHIAQLGIERNIQTYHDYLYEMLIIEQGLNQSSSHVNDMTLRLILYAEALVTIENEWRDLALQQLLDIYTQQHPDTKKFWIKEWSAWKTGKENIWESARQCFLSQSEPQRSHVDALLKTAKHHHGGLLLYSVTIQVLCRMLGKTRANASPARLFKELQEMRRPETSANNTPSGQGSLQLPKLFQNRSTGASHSNSQPQDTTLRLPSL